MKRKDFNKLTASEKSAVLALVRDQPQSLLVRSKEKNLGTSGLPLFGKEDGQTSIF